MRKKKDPCQLSPRDEEAEAQQEEEIGGGGGLLDFDSPPAQAESPTLSSDAASHGKKCARSGNRGRQRICSRCRLPSLIRHRFFFIRRRKHLRNREMSVLCKRITEVDKEGKHAEVCFSRALGADLCILTPCNYLRTWPERMLVLTPN
jgi:hypothetical protein